MTNDDGEFIQRILCKTLKTSNALITLVETKQHCLKKLFDAITVTCRTSEFTVYNEFQTVRPAKEKA